NWFGQLLDKDFETTAKTIVDSFCPDVIHVFGTEGVFPTIQEHTDIPVVIHLQGLINPCLNAYFSPNQSRLNFFTSFHFLKNNLIGNSPGFTAKRFAQQAKRESTILRQAKYVMGRTHWDKMVSSLFNSEVTYFHVDEVLRPPFYVARKNKLGTDRNELSIVSTLSPTPYKGIDVLLRAARKMKELGGVPFRWKVIGLDENDPLFRHFEATENIDHRDVSVECTGRKKAEELIDMLTNANVFVHPSYIDNSPNSVCEAQMLGLPVIACDVGGITTLIKHGESGFLVPSNGVFEIVYYLKKIFRNKVLAAGIGEKASMIAHERHNQSRIVHDLKKVYFKLAQV
ncbi:MAG: glycosyltransferase family 4 protein, partial [Bacteroidales bacterium]|nr:glycosyltransferase family 4 protein [Bacteroidales bacterium]